MTLACQTGARRAAALLVLAAATVLALPLAGCVRPSLSEGTRSDPGRGVAWVIHRRLSQGFSLNGIPVETLAASGKYLIDVLLIPASGEAYAQIGPTLTVRYLNTGRPVWQVGPVSGFPIVTRDALYIGRRGYDLASGKQFRIPVGVPPGSIPDLAGDGVLAFAGSPAGRALADLNPRTGASRWRAMTPRGSRFCGPVAADRLAVVVMRCDATGPGRRAGAVARELDCFDPATGRPRWTRSLPLGWPPASLTAAVIGRTVIVTQNQGDGWSMTVDAMTGAVLPGLGRTMAWMRQMGRAIIGLGSNRTAIVARQDDSPQAARANRDGTRDLRLIDLEHGHVLWTTHLASSVRSRASFGFTSRTLYLLSARTMTAISLRTGRLQAQMPLPITFAATWTNPQYVAIQAPAPGAAGLIAGPRPAPLLAGGLLISQTAEGGLAAIQTRRPIG